MPGPGAPRPLPDGPAPRGAWPRPRIAAAVLLASAVAAVIGTFFSLYTATVVPSDFDDSSSAVGGKVTVEMGFFDTVPFTAPIIAAVIPAAMILAAVAAVPMVVRQQYRTIEVSGLAAVTASVVGLILLIASPVPGVSLQGAIARELRRETSYTDLNDLIGDMLPIGPGAGLIVAFVFSLIAAAAAVTLHVFQGRSAGPRPPAGPPTGPFPAGRPVAGPPPAPPAPGGPPAPRWPQ